MKVDVQYWLVELDMHGNPELIDGSHDSRENADRALYLRKRLGFYTPVKRYAIARIEITKPDNAIHNDINETAAGEMRDKIREYKKDRE